ncbi:MAG: FAD-binding oxidoreductase [Chloroflexi bacterium]|nr:MAG: FAD-binding oxidoreductase [Chloroflexota bacterium]
MIKEDLARAIDGDVLAPGDPGYDTARAVWNAMVDRRPRLVVRCRNVADVRAAVRAARDLNLEIGVRCGGHSVLGLGIPNDGLMIDLTPMGAVRVDPSQKRAWVQGGALLGALDRATQPHGLATTAGNVSHTGVGGLTLGGGMGWLARQHGLSCDNVVSFEMVTADGEIVHASQSENADLYWGLRGGGGNFGVVTEFEFQLHEVPSAALVTTLSFPVDAAGSVLRTWRDLSVHAPRQATFTASLPGEENVVTVGFVWVGHPAAGRPLPNMKSLGKPLTESVVEMSYVDLQRIDDSPQGHAFRRYMKGHYLRQLSDEAIEALVQSRTNGPAAGRPSVGFQAYGGAIAEVPDGDTAFTFRDTAFEYVASSRWTDPAEDASRMAHARRTAAALDPFARGQYVNTLSDEGAEGVRRAYPPEKLARLTAVKDKYDPENVFHLNSNIRPSDHRRA